MSKIGTMAVVIAALCAIGCGKKSNDPTTTMSKAPDAAATPAPAAGTPGVIKIWSSLPRTGSANAQAQTMVNGMKMAIEEVGGKVGDFTIVYEDWDDASPERGQWDPALEAGNAQKAIKDPDIMAYIGTYNSGAAKISMPILNQASLLMVSPANTYPGLTKPGLGEANEPAVYRPTGKVNYFRVVPADDIQGDVAATFAKEVGTKKVFILHDRELYGKGVADVFKRVATKLGLQVTGYEGIDIKAANFRSLVTKIKSTGADLVYFGGTTQSGAGQLAKDLVSSGVKAKLMMPDGCRENALIESAGKENLEGRAYVTFGGLPPGELRGKGADFYATYKKKYNSEPEAYAVYGYEAARVVLECIKRAGKKDRETITEQARQLRDFDGALGKWSFDENGDTSLKIMMVETVKDGKFTPVKIVGQ
jgi:branched-chain amino acid transport system substrate-binding protein